MRAKIVVAAALLLGLVAWDFAAATTFVGDDYLFLAFARLEPNPLLAFTRDMHGGEYYRPLPMLLWWLLNRVGQGAEWPFALAGFLLHAGSAALVVALGRGVGFTFRVSLAAGALFLVAPAEREAALWFAASTDLLATLATLASLVCLLRKSRGCQLASVALAALAYFSKETGLVLPLLGIAAKWAASSRQSGVAEDTSQPDGRNQRDHSGHGHGHGHGHDLLQLSHPSSTEFLRACVAPVVPHMVVAGGYLMVRFAVLGGLGGVNDPVAPWWGRGLQMAAGLVHAVTAYAPLPEVLAWLLGGGVLLVAGVFTVRARVWFPVLWTLLALLPLPAAGWVVGARYYYLPAVGLMLMLAWAAEARGWAVVMLAIALLAAMGLGSTAARMGEVRRYRALLAAARDVVAKGARAGHTIFLVRNAVKDLDLALKLTSPVGRLPQSLLVIPDVPASFVWMPQGLADRTRFLLARPPLPPAGAYRFGGQSIVGLARREEAPDLDEVVARLPELRFIELVTDGRGQVTGRDRTEPRP
jgi:hypothetical protein